MLQIAAASKHSDSHGWGGLSVSLQHRLATRSWLGLRIVQWKEMKLAGELMTAVGPYF